MIPTRSYDNSRTVFVTATPESAISRSGVPAALRSRLFLSIPLFTLITLASCAGSPNSGTKLELTAGASQVVVGQNVLLTVVATGTPDASVNWSVNGIANGDATVGTILPASLGGTAPTHDLTARYSPPASVPNPPNVTLSAALQSNARNQANVTITVGPSITINPAEILAVPTFGSQQFSLSVSGEAIGPVTWQVSCDAGGAACGAISQSGNYSAPNSVPTQLQNGGVVAQNVALTATLVAAPQFPATASIDIVPPNQAKQSLPIPLGTSGSVAVNPCGAMGCVGGTLGSLVERDGIQYILTNWHVAAANDGGNTGDLFIQPGLLDTQCEVAGTNAVANVSQLVDPQAQQNAQVDAAIAQVAGGAVDPTGSILLLGAELSDGVPQSGAPAGGAGAAAYVGEPVAKSGRTTGITCGTVESIDTATTVTYTDACSTNTYTVNFSGQVVISGGGFLADGDSGSLLVDQATAEPVALLFAVSEAGSLANPVADVLAALKDSSGNAPVFVGGAQHAVAACGTASPTAGSRARVNLSADAVREAIAVKEKYAAQLMNDSAIQGVGVGASQDVPARPALIVYVLKNTAHAAIPESIEGIPVRVIETSAFNATVANSHTLPCRIHRARVKCSSRPSFCR
jgi:hypothetical protein